MALELGDAVMLHRDRTYTLTFSENPPEWAIGRDGLLFGYLIFISPVGEGGEPVYGTRLVDGSPGNVEGSDWDQIVKALINEHDPAIEDPFSGSTGATQ
ncbi:hypothetical protein [Herbiconiux daphne]|uniref:Uncharacterized protein n=1 Tax=Herbiconiux daphne TaxID=2970914 RepID=A0ABT2H3T9_9MICO|nr:hypothetical protein [Herbiconiux daphne]MCS5734604.1 hypothetical protein [Herbiconiux daphne]